MSAESPPGDAWRTTIAVDAMGGDHAPAAVVEGAVAAAAELNVDVILTGRSAQLAPLLAAVQAPAHGNSSGRPAVAREQVRIAAAEDTLGERFRYLE